MTEYIVGLQGPPGIQGPQGPEGRQGIQGTPGVRGPEGMGGNSLHIQGTVPTYASLPQSGVTPNEAYVTSDSGKLWIWSGSDWIDSGQFRGFSGTPGQPGAPGQDGTPGQDGRPGAPGEARDLALWIYSQADNLVANGNGYLRNQTNFSQFNSFSLADSSTGSFASFLGQVSKGTYTTDDKIPLALGESYQFRYHIRQTVVGQESVPFYAGLAPIDAYGNNIFPEHYTFLPNTTTTLAQDLLPGQLTIKLTNSANWFDGADPNKRMIIFWNFRDAVGKEWEPHTYSRNTSPENAWDVGGIDRTTHIITLKAPWNSGPVTAGTPVSNNFRGDQFIYSQVNQTVDTEWTGFEREFDATIMEPKTSAQGRSWATWLDGLPPGTSTVKPVWLLNYSDNTGSIHAVSGIFISSTAALRVKTKTATERANEAKAMAETLDVDLADARAEIASSRSELDQTKLDLATAQTNLTQALADSSSAFSQSSQAVQEAQDAWNKAVAAETLATEAAKAGAVVKIDSSRGVLFKQNEVSTILSVTVFKGDQIISDILDLQAIYGAGAYLEWQWQLFDQETWGTISSADPRLSAGGFKLTLGPADVDTKVVFRCSVNGDF